MSVIDILLFLKKTAISILKQEYKIDETKLTDALRLAIKILSKTLDTTKLTSDKSEFVFFYLLPIWCFKTCVLFLFQVEIATLTRENDKTRIRILTEQELNVLIKEYEDEQAKIEAEKLAKEKAAQQQTK